MSILLKKAQELFPDHRGRPFSGILRARHNSRRPGKFAIQGCVVRTYRGGARVEQRKSRRLRLVEYSRAVTQWTWNSCDVQIQSSTQRIHSLNSIRI